MVNLKLDLINYKVLDLDVLLTFWKDSRELGYLNSNSWELQDWVCENLYKDESGDVWVNEYWPHKLCSHPGFYKRAFVSWQYAGYKIKEKIDTGDLILYVIDGENNKYIPCWGKNKEHTDKASIKDKIKAAKHRWRVKRPKGIERCKLAGKAPAKEHIHICCICNPAPIKILKKIDSE